MQRTDSLKKTLMLGKIEGGRRGGWQRMRWWDVITDLMDTSLSTLWEWSLVCCSAWGLKESDTTEQLNWTEPRPSCRECIVHRWLYQYTSHLICPLTMWYSTTELWSLCSCLPKPSGLCNCFDQQSVVEVTLYDFQVHKGQVISTNFSPTHLSLSLSLHLPLSTLPSGTQFTMFVRKPRPQQRPHVDIPVDDSC